MKSHNVEHTVFDLRKSNLDRFCNLLGSFYWSHFYNVRDLNVNDKCSLFHDILSDCIDCTIPRSTVIMKDSDPPWFTPVLKIVSNKRWDAYRSGNMVLYSFYRDKCKRLISVAKLNWAKRCSNNNKSLWNSSTKL